MRRHLVDKPLFHGLSCLPPLVSRLCSYTSFSGCGGNGWWDLTTVEFKNAAGKQQEVCLDGIKLVPGSSSSSSR